LKTIGIIAAAGSGSRVGGKIAKQYVRVAGKEILMHTLELFQNSDAVDEIYVAVREEAIAHVRRIVEKKRIGKVRGLVVGGKHRQDSVFNALLRIDARPSDVVLVHDAVRPFVDGSMILKLVRACSKYQAAVLAVPVKDTVKHSVGRGFFDKTLDRSGLWLVQTPQAFKYRVLMRAHNDAFANGFIATDDASLVERLGVKIKIVEGSYENIKITTPEDLDFAVAILRRRSKGG
jgi:2-C-methyl-D-erythritol 4-phosphate cytidylyltransferase